MPKGKKLESPAEKPDFFIDIFWIFGDNKEFWHKY